MFQVPTWRVSCTVEKSGYKITARYAGSPVRKQTIAMEVYKAISLTREAKVKRLDKTTLSIPPRYPFDLGELQRETYRLIKLSPKTTSSIAQKLYQDALISYPRTDSQKLPEKIGFDKIFEKLSSQEKYASLISNLRSDPKRRRLPKEGPREDPAHPAIYPTGEQPKGNLSVMEWKIFDLVVRRFCNAFASDEIVEKLRITFDLALNDFIADESAIREGGWTAYYPYGRTFDESLPVSFKEGEKVRVLSTSTDEDYERMPNRFSEGSLLAEMEKEGIGTKVYAG